MVIGRPEGQGLLMDRRYQVHYLPDSRYVLINVIEIDLLVYFVTAGVGNIDTQTALAVQSLLDSQAATEAPPGQ